MKQSENLLETQLEPWFSSLQAVPPRAPQATENGRTSFLALAGELSKPVSKSNQWRHTGWIVLLKRYFTHKEYSPMYATIASFVIVLALMFGGTGTAVLAAQDSLPNQPLYQVKTFTEDLALRSTIRNTHRLQMELEYAQRRIMEMIRLRQSQQEIPETVFQRLENHLDQSLLIAANLEDGEMIRALNQVRERLQNQVNIQELDHDPQLNRIREMIQTRLSWTEFGLDEPNEFRMQAQVRTQFNQQAQFEHQYGPGPGPDPEPEPGEGGFGPGPQESGPKYEECQQGECEPPTDNGFGPGPQAEEGEPQQGPGPNEEAPKGDQSPGPGPGSGSNQPPAGDESPGSGSGENQEQGTKNDSQGSGSNSDSAQGSGSNQGNGGKP